MDAIGLMTTRAVSVHAQTATQRSMARAALWVLNLLLVSVLWALTLAAPAHAASRTIVSLTFDDGLTQSPIRDILRNRGVKGTFYVNANLIGTGGGYLTKAELDTLFADGNEIAGHTTNHVDLATLSDAAQRTAICGDLQTLNTWYPNQIHSFAYPFASTGPNTQSIVAGGCTGVGTYSSARTVGGLVSGSQCSGCATAESIPPGNPYFITTPESVLSTNTLDQIKTLVTQAENNGGGWVPLVFHQVCSGSGCSQYSVTAATLDAFVVWLKARETNSTYIRTVHQVMSGDLPAPPPPPPLGPNLLTNPSLELDVNADSVADCWQRDGFGTNTVTWTRTPDAHAPGSFAERLQISAYSSGDRKLIPTLDAGQASGGCAPTVAAGASYELGAWYKATTAVTPVLFYRNASGTWVYWRDGPLLPASASWAQMAFYSGAIPSGAQALSFGISLTSVGTLTTDDYSMKRVLDGTSDSTPPVVAITSPGVGLVPATVTVSASATDNVAVAGVQFLLDGVNLGIEDTASPYSITWNTTPVSNGTHMLTARARDAAGNTTTSAAVSVTVNNVVADTTPPTVSMTAPAAGTVTGTVTVSANAADNIGVAGVQFLLDGVSLGTEDTTSPYSISWNTASASNGTHVLTARARDAAGLNTTSAGVSVTVNNVVAPSSIQNASLETDANSDGVPDCWLLGGYGTNTATWSRVAGRTGSFAESLQVTARTSGDRKLVQTQDAGTCAPAATPGTRYALSAWYKSTVATGFVAYYRNSAGTWVYWASSPTVASAANWAQASYTTPALPAGATHISFGLYLAAVGTLVTDDYAMAPAP